MKPEIYIKNGFQCPVCFQILELMSPNCGYNYYYCNCSEWNDELIHTEYNNYYSIKFRERLPNNIICIPIKICSFCNHSIIVDSCNCSYWGQQSQEHIRFYWEH